MGSGVQGFRCSGVEGLRGTVSTSHAGLVFCRLPVLEFKYEKSPGLDLVKREGEGEGEG
jgi:hypothetical protein